MKIYRGDRVKILKYECGAPTGFKTVVLSIDDTGVWYMYKGALCVSGIDNVELIQK